jgi:hypothetical protein
MADKGVLQNGSHPTTASPSPFSPFNKAAPADRNRPAVNPFKSDMNTGKTMAIFGDEDRKLVWFNETQYEETTGHMVVFEGRPWNKIYSQY